MSRTNKENEIFFDRFRSCLKSSLKDVGFSPNERLDNLCFDYMPFYMDPKPIEFLKDIAAFYAELDPLDRLIFTKEYIQKEKGMSFWWIYYFKKEDFSKAVVSLGQRFKDSLGGVVNEYVNKA